VKYITVFLSGLLFALGLGISGMTLPQKVIGFLDFGGENWDPSLAMVMIGSAGVFLLLHRLVLRRSSPLFETEFHVPSGTDIDAPLVVGAALFGIGWGMVGLCPGPALTALVSGQIKAWIFFVAMITGMYAEGSLVVSNRIIAASGESVDG
jgi:uncharacterized membrane protein YedE/YeeE